VIANVSSRIGRVIDGNQAKKTTGSLGSARTSASQDKSHLETLETKTARARSSPDALHR
jgi:hypothetical protein